MAGERLAAAQEIERLTGPKGQSLPADKLRARLDRIEGRLGNRTRHRIGFEDFRNRWARRNGTRAARHARRRL